MGRTRFWSAQHGASNVGNALLGAPNTEGLTLGTPYLERPTLVGHELFSSPFDDEVEIITLRA